MFYIKNILGDIRNYFDKKKYEAKKKNAKNNATMATRNQNNANNSPDLGGGDSNGASGKLEKRFVSGQPKKSLQEKYGNRKNSISNMLAKKSTTEQNEQAKKIIKKKPHPENKSFKKMARNRQSDLVYLVRGKDQGHDAWHYVLVDRPMLAVFLQKTKGGSLDVANYGTVLYSGWGQDPPKEIVDKINEEFGIQGCDEGNGGSEGG